MTSRRTPSSALPPLLKAMNERTVLEAIRSGAPISRAEISRRAGISKPTVSLALRALVDAGLVREAEHDPDGPSYGAVFFEPVPDAALVLGLDLGARFVRGAVCDLGGATRVRQDVELASSDADAALEAIVALGAGLVDGDRRVPGPRRRDRRRRPGSRRRQAAGSISRTSRASRGATLPPSSRAASGMR